MNVRNGGGGWLLPAQTDDLNAWQHGDCWLYCRRSGLRVLWVGAVKVPGYDGRLYACGPCLAELAHMVREQAHRKDRRPMQPRGSRW